MRPCWQNISLLEHTDLHGELLFEATLMVPPGTKTMVHNKSSTRKSWDFHAYDAWYVGPRHETLPILQSSVGKKVAESTPTTVQFNHHIVQTPKITQADRIHKATTEKTKAIRNEPLKTPQPRQHNHQTAHAPTRSKKFDKKDLQNLNP